MSSLSHFDQFEKKNKMGGKQNFGYEEPDDIGHLVINLGKTRVSFEKNSNGTYTCPEKSCDYTAKRSDLLRKHFMKHTGEKQYQCRICDKGFAKRETCKNHIRTHDDRYKFKCSTCDKKFSQYSVLKKHSLAEHGIVLRSRVREWFWAREDEFPFW